MVMVLALTAGELVARCWLVPFMSDVHVTDVAE